MTHEASRWALREYLGLEVPYPPAVEASKEELVQYVGRYERPFTRIDLGMLAGKLVGQITHKGGFPTKHSPPDPDPPPMSLALCEKDRLLVLDGPLKDANAEAVRKPDGSIGWLRIADRIHARVA